MLRPLLVLCLALTACTDDVVDGCGAPGTHSSGSSAADCACDAGYTWQAPNDDTNFNCVAVTRPPRPTDDREHQSTGETWTFLVYMVADNNLEPDGVNDLTEMLGVGSTSDLSIVVQSDRAVGYSDDPVGGMSNWVSTKRLLVNAGSLEQIEDIGELNMGDPEVLADFIDWGVTNFPADRTALIFWDHGGAWPGFGGDESTQDNDLLSLDELVQGVDAGMTSAGIDQFALIGFDACLMSAWEVAMALRPYGEYMLASEELEPGHGWDYGRLAVLRDVPSADPVDLGSELLQGFRAQAQAQQTDGEITLALVDLYALLPLADAIDELAADMQQRLVAGDATAIGKARAETLAFGNNPNPAGAVHMIDIGHFAARLASEDAAFAAARAAIDDGLGDAVVEAVGGRTTGAATGLSIYFPPQPDFYNAAYDAVPEIDGWRDFLLAYHQLAERTTDAPGFVNANGEADVSWVGDELVVQGQLAAGDVENVADAYLMYSMIDENAGLMYVLGDTVATVYDDGTVEGSWDTTALVISQGSEAAYGYVSVELAGDEYVSATVPFEYVAPGAVESEMCLLTYVFDLSGNVVQATFYVLSDAGPGEMNPEDGSELYPLLLVVDGGGNMSYERSGGPFDPMDESLALSTELLPDGTLIEVDLVVEDFAGNAGAVYYADYL
jgi:hypothetical protein